MGNGSDGKPQSEKEAVAQVMEKCGLTGAIIEAALGLAYIKGQRFGYAEGAADGRAALDSAFSRTFKRSKAVARG